MSRLPNQQEQKALAQALKTAELMQKNKQAAKDQLLRIQLLLARRPIL